MDVEADGPCPGLYSMVSFGVVKVDAELKTTFFGETRPISEKWIPDALVVSKISRETHLTYEDPAVVMDKLVTWLKENSVGEPKFMSDNPCFDWQFIHYYMIAYHGSNPFGHSGRRIGDLYAGLMRNMAAGSRWKKLRKTKHTHHPVDDARGNAEALLAMAQQFDLKIPA